MRDTGVVSMLKPQSERDVAYLAARAIFKNLREKGSLTESELVEIDLILAERFSASEVAKTLKLA